MQMLEDLRERLELIEEIINAEDKFCPAPDKELAVAMTERGVETTSDQVVYYRKMLGLPGCYARRKAAVEEWKNERTKLRQVIPAKA